MPEKIKDSQYIARIVTHNGVILTEYINWPPRPTRDQITGDIILENVKSYIRMLDVLYIKVELNPDYAPSDD